MKASLNPMSPAAASAMASVAISHESERKRRLNELPVWQMVPEMEASAIVPWEERK